MRSSDAHLEKALEEYNEKVFELEKGPAGEELLDAYIKRGCVLSMLGMTTSAIDDFDEAESIITKLEDSGNTVDAGYFVKCYISRGELKNDLQGKSMADDYRIAASRFKMLVPGCKYYDEKKIVEMCVLCAGDLVDADLCADAIPFVEKGLSNLVGKDDDYSRNRYLELSNLAGQAHMDAEENEQAYGYFAESVRVGRLLQASGKLEDEMDLVLAYVSKGDMDEFFKKDDEFFEDREAAIEMMEDMKTRGCLDDEELLSNLHGETAQAYMSKGMVEKAETHLLKQVSYSLNGSTDYMKENNYDTE